MPDIVVGYNGTAPNKNSGCTVCDKNNPANKSGLINLIQVKVLTGIVKVALYYLNAGVLTCRGNAVSLGTVTGGSYQTFTGLSMAINQGDFLGMYAAGGLYYASGALAGYWGEGDKTNAGNTLTGGFGNVKFAVYGESVEVAGGGGILVGSILNSDILRSRILRS